MEPSIVSRWDSPELNLGVVRRRHWKLKKENQRVEEHRRKALRRRLTCNFISASDQRTRSLVLARKTKEPSGIAERLAWFAVATRDDWLHTSFGCSVLILPRG